VKRRVRLRRHGDFQATISGKRFYSGRAIVAFAVPSQLDHTRVGVAASKTFKRSVDRNRARRRMRELARVSFLGSDSPLNGVGIRYDVVIIARPAALEVPYAELVAEAQQAAAKLAKLSS
jgi:ribonuclease P protein component